MYQKYLIFLIKTFKDSIKLIDNTYANWMILINHHKPR